ncbi:uncharacterized protein N7469_009852 [Penicillium citrinum]|uniref:Uncharacterized protein n=2 Tax=Penicillium TaxID=5073 RepID=A0A9W9NJ68_PENCI|nr:uncharacterized protein N7469_009852 [Penicillium citrinum]KAJ5220965.1 hypothetical protein N7469_009852 [Penicillium citrinum]KAJ5595933.1 hypothetical protein N7450_002391 [Penicillium hetheringtonii]
MGQDQDSGTIFISVSVIEEGFRSDLSFIIRNLFHGAQGGMWALRILCTVYDVLIFEFYREVRSKPMCPSPLLYAVVDELTK